MFLLPSLILPFLAFSQEPLRGQLPKADLGVSAFLEAHPEWNGRGIRVAVLDTGVDPGHPLLQSTPDGRRKLVDWYDATTDGRIVVQAKVRAQSGTVYGLSGRKLSLGKWAAENREYGLFRVDLPFLPGSLQQRIEGERRGDWQKDGERYEEAHTRVSVGGSSLDEESLLEMEISRKWETFDDVGPVWDGIVFQDAGNWFVVIDNDEDGDFGEEPALKGFAASGDWATLGDEALLNYGVQVDANGTSLTLFFDTHGHGTHVAGIIGAWEGVGGRMNGIAPGVEFVAIKIGDGKFGGSTSGFAIAKALDYAVEAGCDVANISFGGPSFFADGLEPDAWVVEQATRRGLIVVTSAGNEGPALSTVGAPATTEAAFSIAAAVWPDTQKANYAALDPSAPVLFEFSSRGPLPTGSLGVDFAAPGAALSALPSWGMAKGESWNGTSMAAPQMAGCIALLRCAASAEGVSASPAQVHRAFRLSAQQMPQHAWVEQGHGFIVMEKAWSALQHLQENQWDQQEFVVKTSNPFGVGAGIYLRGLPTTEPFEQTISVAPLFDEDAKNAEKADFLRTFRLESEAGWLQVPDSLYSNSKGNRFAARILPSMLKPGLQETRILLWDEDKPRSLGPDVVIPVTLVIPNALDENQQPVPTTFAMTPASLVRQYYRVPYGATVARIKVTQHGGGRNEYRPGAGSVSGFRYAEDRQSRGRFFLKDGESNTMHMPVEAGMVLEYALSARWATNTPATVDLEVEFLGLVTQESSLTIPAGQGYGYLGVQSLLASADFSVAASVDGMAIPVTASMEIQPDPIRSTVMGGKGMFYGVVSWDLEIPDGGCGVSLHMPHSIQTIELREDLMLEVFDAAGAIQARNIAWEVDTDLGHFEAGTYSCQLTYPSLGKIPLEARFAGAEMRLATGGGKVRVSDNLQEVYGGGGSSHFRFPKGGARTAIFEAPKLEALPAGAYWYGSASFKSHGESLLTLPLQVHRPQHVLLEEEPAELKPEEASADAEELAEANPESLYEEAVDLGECSALERVGFARDWAEASPESASATLAVLVSLAEGGVKVRARELARGFLVKFPQEVDDFLAAAPLWN